MDFPDPDVQKIVDRLKIASDSGKTIDLKFEIENFSLSQRLQIFCLAMKMEILNPELFPLEMKIWEKFQEIFRNDHSETIFLIDKYDIALELAGIALLTELVDLEDYRAVIRFLYMNMEDFTNSTLKLNLNLLHYLREQNVGPQVLRVFNLLLRFLGIPLIATEELKNDLIKFFPYAQSDINSFFELPITTMQRYPEYLDEIAEQLNYDQSIPILKDWLDHDTLFKLEEAKISHFIKSWKPGSVNTLKEFETVLKDSLTKNNLTSVPVVFNSFIKPFSASLKPSEVRMSDLSSEIPPEIIQTYVEKVGFQLSSNKEQKIRITFLGGAQIGTMGILISTHQSNILLDYGMSVANYSIPYWHDALSYLDAVLISHAHLDHIGAIPYLFAQGYQGYVFGSNINKTLASFLLIDNCELMNKYTSKVIRDSDHRFKVFSQSAYVYQMLDRYITLKPGNKYQLTPDIVIKPIPAYHIQGSFGYLIECGSKKILFSGDFNLDPTALFGEKVPSFPIDADLSIIDSTYYGQPAFDPVKRDKLLFSTVREDERVIIPAFSVGRAQEIMIKLEKTGLTKERKVSMLGMATKVARISGMKTRGHLSNQLVKEFDDEIVITGGGMLSGGYARELTENTKNDPNTTIVLCGYLAKSTLGYRLLHNLEPQYKQKVVFTRFSGHSSSKTLSTYLDSLKGKKVLVHLGSLTKDPFTSKKTRESYDFSRSHYIIPSLGSSLEI
jgi:predicted metal-dependent RNase